MGDIADMMLEGVLCQICGEYLGDGDGYPVTCSGCQKTEKERMQEKVYPESIVRNGMRFYPCGKCGKWKLRSPFARDQHSKMKH